MFLENDDKKQFSISHFLDFSLSIPRCILDANFLVLESSEFSQYFIRRPPAFSQWTQKSLSNTKKKGGKTCLYGKRVCFSSLAAIISIFPRREKEKLWPWLFFFRGRKLVENIFHFLAGGGGWVVGVKGKLSRNFDSLASNHQLESLLSISFEKRFHS